MGLYQGNILVSSGGGKTSYEYAKEHGFLGTKDEFYEASSVMPEHLESTSNPHAVTAEQIGAATPADIQEAIADIPTESDIFVATYGTTTNAEIEEAHQAGKAIYVKNSAGTRYGVLFQRNSATSHMFVVGLNAWMCGNNNWVESQAIAAATHASQHATDGADPITPDSIGALSKAFEVGTTAPTNTNLLWIDTAGGLKYHNGTDWVTVPVAYN